MASAVKFEVFSEHLAEKVHNLDADTIKNMLTNGAPNAATHTVKADLTEIGAGNGYSAGGNDTQNATSRSGGTTTVGATDIVVTASGGSIGPFRYVAAYNDTPTSPADPLIEYWDYGSSITLLDGETFTEDFGASGLMTIA
jgi:hypothetical protein